jgi:2-polyprenyl-3-methyl-5-hydroxy-6-metoxy-1,4-benzoquinol methylase
LDLKEQQQLGAGIEQHWYYRAKGNAVLRMLRQVDATQVLDVGAGSGYFSRRLLEAGLAHEAWCVDPHYPQDSDEEWDGKPAHFRRSYRGGQADLVLMMDVLEHVEDDLALLKTYVRAVQPGTHFLITVPAFQWLWSGHDVFLEHYRRYTLAGVESLLRAGGLELRKGAYFFGLLLPPVAAVRWLGKLRASTAQTPESDLKLHSPWVNALLAQVCRLELPLFQWNRLGGLSALCLARKA